MKRRVFLSTPLRDEIDNIPKLFEAVAAQGHDIDIWVIVENGSTDGSREDLQQRKAPPNVKRLIVLNEDTEAGEYALGAKYARLVNRGFTEVREQTELGHEDLIGILDADSFPQPGYYTALSNAFDADPKLGIASGLSRDTGSGQRSIHASDWPRGSCRLWRGGCMLQSGYIIGPTADTLSLGQAELDGWRAAVVPDAIFFAREVGALSKQKYYGASTWYRGNSFLYALFRTSKFFLYRRPGDGFMYLSGYVEAMFKRAPRLQDKALRQHFSTYLTRKIAKKLGFGKHRSAKAS